MPGNSFKTSNYHWAIYPERFWPQLEGLLDTVSNQGVLSADSLIVWHRNLGFLDDDAFVSAWQRESRPGFERGIIWRTAVLVWAARQALRREGGFVECGCYAGTTARIVIDAAGIRDRPVFLYDLFEHDPETMAHHAMPEHGPDLFERVRARFAADENVRVIQGPVPASFDQGVPDKIAFAHIDMNNAPSEIAALDALESRLVPGAVIVLDDHGQLYYRDQHLAHREWFAQRGAPILESPTGQGIVIW